MAVALTSVPPSEVALGQCFWARFGLAEGAGVRTGGSAGRIVAPNWRAYRSRELGGLGPLADVLALLGLKMRVLP